MSTVNYWSSQQPSYERPKWGSQRPATPPSFFLSGPDDRAIDAITWTRATTRSVTDYQGNIWQALSGEVPWQGYRRVHNLVNYSEALGSLSLARATVSSNVAANPIDGATTADKLVCDGTAASTHYAQNAAYAAIKGEQFIYSGYFKAAELTWVRLEVYQSSTGQQSGIAYFNLSAGTVGTLEIGVSHGIEDLGGGWHRCWIKSSATAATENVRGGVMLAEGDLDSVIDGDSASGLYVYGLQLERARPGQTTPDEYVSVRGPSTPYHGAQVHGVKYFNTDDQGRLIDGTRGYDRDGTGAWVESSSVTPIAPGLSIESLQTNRIPDSSDLSGWTPGNSPTVAVGYDAQVGVYTRLTLGSGAYVYKSATGFTASARTEAALMARVVAGTGTLSVQNAQAASYGQHDVAPGSVSATRFERIDRFHSGVTVATEFSATSGGNSGVLLIAVGGSVTVDVALVTQVEAQRVQSLIYSAGSVTAKNADAPSFTALPTFATNNEGTTVVDLVPYTENGGSGVNLLSGVRTLYSVLSPNEFRSFDGTTALSLAAYAERVATRAAVCWEVGVGRSGYQDGIAKFSSGAYDGAMESSTLTLNGPMLLRELSIYPTALTAAQLQALSS